MEKQRRGRPRDENCSAAILSATIELVAEVGIASMTVDAVAARAGVGKASIYRRWSSKEALMLDAWKSCIIPNVVPDTGSLRGDLEQMYTSAAQPLSDLEMQRVFPQMIAAAKVNPDVTDAYRAYLDERRRPMLTALNRAVERGELPPGTDIEVVHDLLVAPLVYRWLVTDGQVDPALRARIVDVVLAGIGALVPHTA